MKYPIEMFDEMTPKAKPTTNQLGAVNDLEPISKRFDGKRYDNPIYNHWRNMLKRAFDPNHHARYPTYIGTTISDEFMTFSNFDSWYRNQYGCDKGWHVDKDVKGSGKHYSADTCILIPGALNLLLTDRDAERGGFPSGVVWNEPRGKLQAMVSENGKYQPGTQPRFDDVIEATEYVIKLKRDIAERTVARTIPGHPDYDEIEAAVYASLDARAVEQRAHAKRCKQLAVQGISYAMQNDHALRVKANKKTALLCPE
jgi:hypothetical protein